MFPKFNAMLPFIFIGTLLTFFGLAFVGMLGESYHWGVVARIDNIENKLEQGLIRGAWQHNVISVTMQDGTEREFNNPHDWSPPVGTWYILQIKNPLFKSPQIWQYKKVEDKDFKPSLYVSQHPIPIVLPEERNECNDGPVVQNGGR